jgi:hypothetical protein
MPSWRVPSHFSLKCGKFLGHKDGFCIHCRIIRRKPSTKLRDLFSPPQSIDRNCYFRKIDKKNIKSVWLSVCRTAFAIQCDIYVTSKAIQLGDVQWNTNTVSGWGLGEVIGNYKRKIWFDLYTSTTPCRPFGGTGIKLFLPFLRTGSVDGQFRLSPGFSLDRKLGYAPELECMWWHEQNVRQQLVSSV